MSTLSHFLQQLCRPRVLVIGDLILDRYTWGSVKRISPEAPIPVFRVEREETRLGGAGAVLVNLAVLEAAVQAVGVLGADPEGDHFLAEMERRGIDASGIVRTPARPTTVKTRFLSRTQQLLRVDAEQDGRLDPQTEAALVERARELVKQADLVLVSDYGKGVLKGPLLKELAKWRREHGIPVLLDPARTTDFQPYAGMTALTPNRDETEMATGVRPRDEATVRQAGQLLMDGLGLDFVVITLDRDGMVLLDTEGGYHHVPTRPVQVYDVAGAGDMVLSVLGLVLAAGGSREQALQLANFAGGLEVQRLGVTPLTRQEIRSAVEESDSPRRKVMRLEELQGELLEIRRQGKRVVFTNGCFDVLHVGHLKLLEFARRQGDMLIVGLNSDASVRRLKGPQRPILDESHRAQVLAGLEDVDRVVLFDEETPLEIIRTLRPEVLVKGEDYRDRVVVGRELVEEAGGEVVLAPLVLGISTSEIVRRIQQQDPAEPNGR